MCLLAALSLLTLLAGLAQDALGAETFGALSGRVTDASTHAPVAGIEVCARAVNIELFEEEEEETEAEEEHVFGCATTGAGGEYAISELRPERYGVVFSAGGKLDYITEYYGGSFPPAEPTPVTVLAGMTTPSVNAELMSGAQIKGRVTDASTGAPIDGAIVCAIRTGAEGSLEAVSCAFSDAGGEYTLLALPTGAYKVGFASTKYVGQYYDDESTQTQASSVSVTAPSLTSGIDAAMQLAAPLAPAVPLPGIGSPGTKPAGSGRRGAGSTGAGPSAPTEGTLSVLGGHLLVRHGVALVKVDCAGVARCRAKITLRVDGTVTVKGRRTRRAVAIGTSPVLSIAAARKVTVTIVLDRAARGLLSAHHGRLDAVLALVTPGHTRHESVVLIAQSPGG